MRGDRLPLEHLHRHRGLAAALSTIAGLLLALPAPAAARDLPSPLDLHREVRAQVHDVLSHAPSPLRLHRAVRADVHGLLRELGRVPHRIDRRHERHLEVFLGGSAWYQPHRHQHRTYHFPVWIEGAVVYRPYVYCNDVLFTEVRLRPQLWFEWGDERSAHWCDRCHHDYPSAHRCFRVDRRYDRRDPRDGRSWRDDDCGRRNPCRGDDRDRHRRGRGHERCDDDCDDD